MKAFPNPTLADTQNNSSERLNNPDEYGLDLRDYFAATAPPDDVRAIAADIVHEKNQDRDFTDYIHVDYKMICRARFIYADQMMEARECK